MKLRTIIIVILLVLFSGRVEKADWLLGGADVRAEVNRSVDGKEITLSNGLVRRTIRIAPNAATVALDNLVSGESMLRAVAPEAVIELDGKSYSVGGLTGQPNLAYLKSEWLDAMKSDPDSFQFERYETGKPEERMVWKRSRHSADSSWPPAGVKLSLWFKSPNLPGIRVAVHYELYDGVPLIAKWITVRNETGRPVRLNRFKSEVLRVVETESHVDPSIEWIKPKLTVITDYSFGGMSITSSNRTVFWESDPEYKTQVNYELKSPCLLEVRPPVGPDAEIEPGKSFDSFRAFELSHDDYDRERQGLAIRKMFRLLAPWSTENPIMLHLTSTDPKIVYPAIDQAAECGFEMIIISFGSRFNMEDVSEANIKKFREFREYANSKGLGLGGYSLLASRKISEEDDVINPKTGKTGGQFSGIRPVWGADGESTISNASRSSSPRPDSTCWSTMATTRAISAHRRLIPAIAA